MKRTCFAAVPYDRHLSLLVCCGQGDINRSEVLSILKAYVVDDLRFHPISARPFGKYLKAAAKTLTDILIDGMLAEYTPCVLIIIAFKDAASDTVIERENERETNLVNALVEDVNLRPC